MRIMLSCLQSLKKHDIPAYGFWRGYFVQGLREAGHEILEVPNVDWVEGLTHSDETALEEWRARTWEATVTFARQEHARAGIPLFVSYLYPKQVNVAAIAELQRMGISCVNFFCDNVREFARVPLEYKPFSLHWVPEFEALPMYKRAELPYIHAPMPCWVPMELRDWSSLETEPATFIGSADVLRRDLLGRANDNGAHFVVRGPGWTTNTALSVERQVPRRSFARVFNNQLRLARERGWLSVVGRIESKLWPLHPRPIPDSCILSAVSDADYTRVTREAIVTIGVNRVVTINRSPRRPVVYSRLRDIEAPMLGACYLTEWTEGLEHMYELGTEIETYRTADELSSKLSELERDHSRRSKMRNRAQRRALAHHSVARSIASIGARLGISKHA